MDMLIIEPHRMLLADMGDGAKRIDMVESVVGALAEAHGISGPGDVIAYRATARPGTDLEPNILATLFCRLHGSLAPDGLLRGNCILLGGDGAGGPAAVPAWVVESVHALLPQARAMADLETEQPS